MRWALLRLVDAWRDRRRRHKEGLEASKRLGHDEAAWAQLFRREDWSGPKVGHYGRCGNCGAELDRAASRCPKCGAEWRPNMRRSDLLRQVAVYSVAVAASALAGYAGAGWLRSHFEAIEARGEFVNPEMVDTLASFTWLFCSVMAMIGFTYVIERLAPTGHWRKEQTHAEDGKAGRKTDARA